MASAMFRTVADFSTIISESRKASGALEELAGTAKATGTRVSEALSSGGDQARNSFGKAGAAAANAFGDEFAKSEPAVQAKAGRVFTSLKSFAMKTLGGLGVARILTSGWGRLTAIEDARAKLSGLGHSFEAVEKISANALAAVKGTVFGMDEAATLAASAVAAGIKPGIELERVLRLMADTAQIAGIDLQTVGKRFNEVMIRGQLTSSVVTDFASAGLPLLNMLATQFGVTAEEAAKMVERGEVSFEQFANAIETNIGGAALQAGETTSGTLKNMGAAVSRFGATVLESFMPMIKSGLQGATALFDLLGGVVSDVVGVFAGLPGPVKIATAALAAFYALRGTAMFGSLVEGGRSLIGVLSSIRSEGLMASGVLSGLGKAAGIAAVAIAVTTLSKAWQGLNDELIEGNQLIDANTNRLNANSKEMLKQQLSPYIDQLNDAGVVLDDLVEKMLSSPDAAFEMASAIEDGAGVIERGYKKMDGAASDVLAKLPLVGQYFERDASKYEVADLIRNQTNAITDQGNALLLQSEAAIAAAGTSEFLHGYWQSTVPEDYASNVDGASESTFKFNQTAAEGQQPFERLSRAQSKISKRAVEIGRAMWEGAEGANALAAASDSVAESLDLLSGRAPTVEESMRRFNGIMSEASKALELGKEDTGTFTKALSDTTGVIDTSSTAGQKLFDWVTKASEASRQAALDQAALTGETEGLEAAAESGAKAQEAQIKAFRKTAKEAGVLKEDVEKLIETYFDTPEAVYTTIMGEPDFSVVHQQIEALRRMTVRIPVTANMNTEGIRAQGGWQLKAAGGWIHGPGTETSDSIFARLSRNEFVVNARSAKRHATLLELINADKFADGGFVGGGNRISLRGAVDDSKLIEQDLQKAVKDAAKAVGKAVGKAATDAAKAAEKAAKDAVDRQEKRRTILAGRVTTAIGAVGTTPRAPFDLADVGIDRITKQIAKANEKLDDAIAKGLDKKRVTEMQKEIDKLAKEANKQLGNLELKIKGSDLKTLRKSLKGTVSEMQDAMKQLQNDLKAAGAPKALIKGLQVAEKQLTKMMTEREAVTDRLATAQAELNRLLEEHQRRVDSVRDSTVAYLQVANSGGLAMPEFMMQLRQRAADVREWAKSVDELRKRGLSGAALQQVIDAGPEAAEHAAQLAAASQSEITEINQLMQEVFGYGGRVGQLSADMMYGQGISAARSLVQGLEAEQAMLTRAIETLADGVEVLTVEDMKKQGVNAAKGLISGLKSQQGALNSQMQSMAKQMLKAFQKELKIKSPSQVFADDGGREIARGAVLGVEREMPAARSAIERFAVSLVDAWSSAPVDIQYDSPFQFDGLADVGDAVASFSGGAPAIRELSRDGDAIESRLARIESVLVESSESGRRVMSNGFASVKQEIADQPRKFEHAGR